MNKKNVILGTVGVLAVLALGAYGYLKAKGFIVTADSEN